MRLGFISLGTQLIRYFSELQPQLQTLGIESRYFTFNPKVRSMMTRMELAYFPTDINECCDSLSAAQFDAIVNPVLEFRYPDRRQLDVKVANLHFHLREFIECQKIDGLFLWNGSGLVASIAQAIARERGLPVLFGENGYLPSTMQIDPEGVNQLATVTRRVADEYQNQIIDPKLQHGLNEAIDILHSGRPWAKKVEKRVKASVWMRLNHEIKSLSWDRIRRGVGGNKGIEEFTGELPERYVFVPMQVETDSQLILHSPLVGRDMVHFVEVCQKAVADAAPDCRVVVKLHPANLGKIDYTELAKRYPDVVFLKGGKIGELIKNSEAIITINSTVGFEALTYYKPVLTLGNCFYNVEGVVHRVRSLNDLSDTLVNAIQQPVDKTRIDQLLYYLYADYFAHGSWKDFSSTSFEQVSSKIATLLNSNRE